MTNTEFLTALFSYIVKHSGEWITEFLYSVQIEFVKNTVSYSVIIVLLHLIYILTIDLKIKVNQIQKTQTNN